MIRAASLTSPRLQKVLKVLRDGKPHSTREISRKSHVLAVSTTVAELRSHGAQIRCTQQLVDDRRVWFYTMTKAPKNG